jgi:hypothetical protein
MAHSNHDRDANAKRPIFQFDLIIGWFFEPLYYSEPGSRPMTSVSRFLRKMLGLAACALTIMS